MPYMKATVESAFVLPPYDPFGKRVFAASRKNAHKKKALFIGILILTWHIRFVKVFCLTNVQFHYNMVTVIAHQNVKLQMAEEMERIG